MRTITTEAQAYTIHELSDKAKERAHYQWLENLEFYGAEYIIEDAKRLQRLWDGRLIKYFIAGLLRKGTGLGLRARCIMQRDVVKM